MGVNYYYALHCSDLYAVVLDGRFRFGLEALMGWGEREMGVGMLSHQDLVWVVRVGPMSWTAEV